MIFFILILGSCTQNFDDINQNPNSPEEVVPSLLLADIILDVAQPAYGKNFFNASLTARQIVWTETIESYQYYYFERSSFYGYGSMRSVQKMVQEAERTGEPAYIALSHFFNAWFLYDMTMVFGDVPYVDALKGETDGEYFPKYDTQEDVFIGILDQLEQANLMLASTDGTLEGDILYGGNLNQWRKAVNSFALKVLISLSNREGSSVINISEKFNQIVSDPDQYPIFNSNADNMQLVFSDKGGERFPFYNSSHKPYPNMDEFLVNLLKERSDKRLFFYAAPTGNAVSQGLANNDFNAYNGADGTADFNSIVAQEAAKNLSRVHERYYADFNAEPYVSLGFVELQFNLAEAAYRGWITESADNYYNAGIRASMEFFKNNAKSYPEVVIDDNYINTYLNSAPVAYNSSEGLEQIITQKYIASFLNTGWSSYYNYRRTGFPKLKINPATSLNKGNENMIPLRWRYPQKEVDYNTAHVEEAIKRQFGEDDINGKMWLLK